MGNQHILPFGGCTPVRAVAHPKRFAVSVNDPNLSDCVKKEPVPGWLDAHYEGCAHSESLVHFGDSNFAYADPRIGMVSLLKAFIESENESQ